MPHWIVSHKKKREVIALEDRPDSTIWEEVVGPFAGKEIADAELVKLEDQARKEAELWK